MRRSWQELRKLLEDSGEKTSRAISEVRAEMRRGFEELRAASQENLQAIADVRQSIADMQQAIADLQRSIGAMEKSMGTLHQKMLRYDIILARQTASIDQSMAALEETFLSHRQNVSVIFDVMFGHVDSIEIEQANLRARVEALEKKAG